MIPFVLILFAITHVGMFLVPFSPFEDVLIQYASMLPFHLLEMIGVGHRVTVAIQRSECPHIPDGVVINLCGTA